MQFHAISLRLVVPIVLLSGLAVACGEEVPISQGPAPTTTAVAPTTTTGPATTTTAASLKPIRIEDTLLDLDANWPEELYGKAYPAERGLHPDDDVGPWAPDGFDEPFTIPSGFVSTRGADSYVYVEGVDFPTAAEAQAMRNTWLAAMQQPTDSEAIVAIAPNASGWAGAAKTDTNHNDELYRSTLLLRTHGPRLFAVQLNRFDVAVGAELVDVPAAHKLAAAQDAFLDANIALDQPSAGQADATARYGALDGTVRWVDTFEVGRRLATTVTPDRADEWESWSRVPGISGTGSPRFSPLGMLWLTYGNDCRQACVGSGVARFDQELSATGALRLWSEANHPGLGFFVPKQLENGAVSTAPSVAHASTTGDGVVVSSEQTDANGRTWTVSVGMIQRGDLVYLVHAVGSTTFLAERAVEELLTLQRARLQPAG